MASDAEWLKCENQGRLEITGLVYSSLMKGGGVDGKAPYRTREAYIWGVGGTVGAAAGNGRVYTF